MKLAADNGFRAIAHDRRGHGRSTPTWHSNDMDTYAEDLDALVRALNLETSSWSAIRPAAVKWSGSRHGTASAGWRNSPRSTRSRLS
ncbi:alpha/beta fold hydrolase [Micromonospora sp. CA-240977]|uniref:alpha/beta fold hydrolase n=1 Tax=Micromonospora sp. CA-240977 TaxID=3239957 RepID=UPI003D8E391A